MPQSTSYLLGTKGHHKKKCRKQNLHIARIKCRSALACFECFFPLHWTKRLIPPQARPLWEGEWLSSTSWLLPGLQFKPAPRTSSQQHNTSVYKIWGSLAGSFTGCRVGSSSIIVVPSILTYELELTGSADLWLQLAHYTAGINLPSKASSNFSALNWLSADFAPFLQWNNTAARDPRDSLKATSATPYRER